MDVARSLLRRYSRIYQGTRHHIPEGMHSVHRMLRYRGGTSPASDLGGEQTYRRKSFRGFYTVPAVKLLDTQPQVRQSLLLLTFSPLFTN